MRPETILIVGVGQLGSRYLQGLAKFPRELRVLLSDPSEDAIGRAVDLWNSTPSAYASHRVESLGFSGSTARHIDLAIIATNADVRAEVVCHVANDHLVRNWLLEKVLAQSEENIQRMIGCVATAPAWVNTPMHLWSLYKNLRYALPPNEPIHATFDGFEGLACSAIHFIDFIARCRSALVTSVNTDFLDSTWVASKRKGFAEVNGELVVSFSDGSTLRLIGHKDAPAAYRAELLCAGELWVVNEQQTAAFSSRGRMVTGRAEYQSELTSDLVESILTRGSCNLPTLAQSADQHRPLLLALLRHWNTSNGMQDRTVPIT